MAILNGCITNFVANFFFYVNPQNYLTYFCITAEKAKGSMSWPSYY